MRLALLLVSLLALPARADELLEKILARLAEPQVVRADFVQERFIADIARPTVSRGRLTVSRREGVLWRIESPVHLVLAFTPDEIVETGSDGVRRLRAQRRGAVDAEIARVMRGILGADAEALRDNFDAAAQGGLERWTIRLAPRAREVARFLRQIRLGGGRHLETIEIEETTGNHTAIRMRNIAIAGELDAAEREQFRAP
jgi:hypothetical protein